MTQRKKPKKPYVCGYTQDKKEKARHNQGKKLNRLEYDKQAIGEATKDKDKAIGEAEETEHDRIQTYTTTKVKDK